MSLIQLKQKAAALPVEEQRELMRFLASLLGDNDAALRSELFQKLDDPDPSRWISLEDAQKRWED